MTLSAKSFIKKGYIPLACNAHAGIALEGDYLPDFWMTNGQRIRTSCGGKRMLTMQVTSIKEAAVRCWRDGWLPVANEKEELIVRLEQALREHRGLKRAGVSFPDTPFLKRPLMSGQEAENGKARSHEAIL